MHRISFVGAGNVAWRLAHALKDGGFSIVDIWSRTIDSAAKLADLVDANAVERLDDLSKDIDVLVIALPDAAIVNTAAALKGMDCLVVHTAGTMEMKVLKPYFSKIGVFYPLQSLSKNRAIDFRKVPLCVEAEDASSEALLFEWGSQLSSSVYRVSSAARKKLHLAAVFVSNFVNHLYVLGSDILAKEDLPFDLLLPLIEETALRLHDAKAQKVQTGPAIRNDIPTIHAHLDILSEKHSENLADLYKLLTKSIVDYHNSKTENTE